MRAQNEWKEKMRIARMMQKYGPEWQEKRQRRHRITGVLFVVFGILFLLIKLGILSFIQLHSFWPLILIAIGLYIGIDSNFKNRGAFVLLFIGIIFSIPQFTILGKPSSILIFPGAVIATGLYLLLRSKKKYDIAGQEFSSQEDNITFETNNEPFLNIDVVFGGKKEIITNKNFKGGKINVTFGGTEVNLMNADMDIHTQVVLDCSVNFGGLELIVPSDWEIQNEISAVLGDVSDKRNIKTRTENEPLKKLILRGSCSFGGIEIKGY